MTINNKRAIFANLKHGLINTTARGVSSNNLGNERARFVNQDVKVKMPARLFPGEGGDTVEITVHPGSEVDNRPETTDSIAFSYGGHEYVSTEKSQSGNSVTTQLYINQNGKFKFIDNIRPKK